MARRLLRKYLPDPQRLAQERGLRIFGKILFQPNLWHLNRKSVARACAVGLFWTCVPMPFQMIPATACAIWMRANLAITAALTWISNPLTWGPQVYATYRLGRWTLQQPPPTEFDPSWEWLCAHLAQAWLPFLIGTMLTSTALATGSYLAVQLLWRWQVARAWRRRVARRAKRLDANRATPDESRPGRLGPLREERGPTVS